MIDVSHLGAWMGAIAIGCAGCSKTSAIDPDTTQSTGSTEANRSYELPGPYRELKLGASRESVLKLFAPLEDVGSCSIKLIGGDRTAAIQVPGAEKHARSRCPRIADVAGITDDEESRIQDWAERNRQYAARRRIDFADNTAGDRYSIGQVRASLRAGVLQESAIIEAANGKSNTAYGSAAYVATELYRGGEAFIAASSTRRTVCALIADSCDDLDPDRVRAYVAGDYTLGQIDADAHSRVVYGACRAPYLRAEHKIAGKLLRRAGGLGAIGLARASRAEHTLSPDEPATYSVFSSRSRLDPRIAKVGVTVANSLPDVERYFDGAVALLPADAPGRVWGSALVWFQEGKVSRVLINLADEEALGELPAKVEQAFKAKGTSTASRSTWALSNAEAQLDIGAPLSLLLSAPSPQSSK